MIKILHLITGLETGGAEMMLYKLVSRMDRTRFDTTVVSMTGLGTIGERIRALGVPVLSLGMGRGIPDPRGVLRLIKILRKVRPEVLQSWLYHADLIGLIAGRLAGVPAILWNIRHSESRKEDISIVLSLTLKLLAVLSGMPKAVVVNSSNGRLVHEGIGYRPRRWELIPNGFDTSVFKADNEARMKLRKSLGLGEGVFLIGLVARLHPMKDHPNFLKAAGLILKARPKTHFILVGKGVESLTPLISELGIGEHLHILGEREDLPEITAALDVAVSSSSYGEGFPNVIGEAMASGVPCVVTDVGDSALIVGESGIIVPPADPSALSEACLKLMEMSEAERKAMGSKARKRVEVHYSVEGVVSRYEELYMDVLR